MKITEIEGDLFDAPDGAVLIRKTLPHFYMGRANILQMRVTASALGAAGSPKSSRTKYLSPSAFLST